MQIARLLGSYFVYIDFTVAAQRDCVTTYGSDKMR